MKPLSFEDEARGLKAYEQARAFEALRGRGLPYIYTGFGAFIWLVFLVNAYLHLNGWINLLWLVAATWFTVQARANWVHLQALYAANCQLLDALKREYGPDLPWLRIERQQAILADIHREEAASKSAPVRQE